MLLLDCRFLCNRNSGVCFEDMEISVSKNAHFSLAVTC